MAVTPESSLLFRKKSLLAKIEAVAGTDPNATANANSIQTIGLDVVPMEGEAVDIPRDRAELGHVPQAILSTRARARFGISVAGAGAAAQATRYEPLLQACGLTPGVGAADPAAQAWAQGTAYALYARALAGGSTYECVKPHAGAADNKPDTGADRAQYWRLAYELPAHRSIVPASELATIWLQANLDGVRHIVPASRGTFTMGIESGAMPQFQFDFVGEFRAPSAAAAPVPTDAGWTDPIPVSEKNTPIARLGPLDLVVNSFSFDIGNDLEFINDPNRAETVLSNRLPGGSVRFEMYKPTAQNGKTYASNLFGAVEALASERMRIRHGTDAGKIVEFYAGKVQLTEPSIVEAQGRYMIEAGFRVLDDAGDDFYIRTF